MVNTIANSAAYNPFNGVLTLFDNLIPMANLHCNGSYTTSNFELAQTAAGTEISYFV